MPTAVHWWGSAAGNAGVTVSRGGELLILSASPRERLTIDWRGHRGTARLRISRRNRPGLFLTGRGCLVDRLPAPFLDRLMEEGDPLERAMAEKVARLLEKPRRSSTAPTG